MERSLASNLAYEPAELGEVLSAGVLPWAQVVVQPPEDLTDRPAVYPYQDLLLTTGGSVSARVDGKGLSTAP
jgi:hypothetical protein